MATSASSSASTSPMPITPQSTGGPAAALSSNGAPSSPTGESSMPKKTARRQAGVFTHAGSPKPVKPFSRSAAKRESVLALGSIEHLQQYYTRTGMVNKKNPLFDKKHYGMVPAIGGMPLSPTAGTHIEEETPASFQAALQPQPEPVQSAPPPTIVAPHVKSHEAHPDSLLPGVITELSELVKLWEIDDDVEPSTSHPIDVLPLLRTTTRTVQTVRNYVLSLPDDSVASIKTQFKRTPSSSQPTSNSTPPLDTSDPSSSAPPATPPDPLALIRRCSLDVLACLRELEETARLPLSDDAYDAQSDGAGSQRGSVIGGPTNANASPRSNPLDLPPDDPTRSQYYGDLGITFSLVQVHGKFQQVAVWEDSDNEDFNDPDGDSLKERRELLWHERLEVGNGWLYKRDLRLSDLERERGVVERYLDAVDRALFPPTPGNATNMNPGTSTKSKKERGWDIERKKIEIRTSRFASLTSGVMGPRSRSKSRRVSSGEALIPSTNALSLGSPGSASSALLLESTGGKRRISTGMLGVLGAAQKGLLVAEPEDMMGGIREDEEEDGEEDEEDGEMVHELEDDELPEWARRSAFEDDELGRAYAFISAYLPSTYHHALIPPSSHPPPDTGTNNSPPSRSAFLSSLSSGQLLCLAYNVCVRKSKHPWGFVSKEGIHDIIALEKAAALVPPSVGTEGEVERVSNASKTTGWTFRRTDNLRLWIGALKLRYMLPIQMPSQIIHAIPPSLLKLPSVVSNLGGSPRGSAPSSPRKLGFNPPAIPPSISSSKSYNAAGSEPSSSTSSSPSTTATTNALRAQQQQSSGSNSRETGGLMFDAKVVARKEDGWEDMLEGALLRWMWKAVGEKRKAVPTPIG